MASYGSSGAYTSLPGGAKTAPAEDERRAPPVGVAPPQTARAALLAFWSGSPEGTRARLLVGVPVLLGGAVAYGLWFGLDVMGWSLVQTLYFFCVTVTTTGYSAPTADWPAAAASRQYALVVYMWLAVVLAGGALAVVIAAVQEAAENAYEAAAAPPVAAAHRLGAARAVEAARRKAAFFRARLARQGLTVVVAVLVGVAATASLEGWSWADASAFVTETVTSIGYGETEPTTAAGKLFVAAYCVVATLLFARVVGLCASSVAPRPPPRRGARGGDPVLYI